MTGRDIHKTTPGNHLNAIILLTLLVVITFPVTRFFLTPLLMSLFLVIFITPLINHLESVGFGRVSIIVLFTFIILSLVIAAIWKILPHINNESLTIAKQLDSPALIASFEKLLPISRDSLFLNLYSSFIAYLKNQSVNTLRNYPPIFMMIFIVPIISFLLLKDGYYLKKAFVQSLPNHYIEMMVNLIHNIEDRMSIWLKGQLLVSIIAGGLTTLALISLHISSFLLIGIMVGFSFLTPHFGPLIGTCIAITITILETGSLRPAIAIIVAFATIKLLHNLLFETYVKQSSMELHPVIVLLLLFSGAYMGGFIGLLTIVPAANIFIIFTSEIYSNLKTYKFI